MLAPAWDAVPEIGSDSDHRLVAAIRRGDDRAFELLYQRYQRRIQAYVLGMVKDHGRAEDVTQEVFVSALRRIRATERPIAFKPWIYEIAKNACIDAFRRSKRGEEVSYDADGALGPADQSRLAGRDPSPEAAIAAKQDLETLCGAFGGLSPAHHQILVLRELEGLSYEQIGERMGLTRPAVESTLFRARRRLSEEYDELVSGARCARVQATIAAAAQGAVGVRDSRRLDRHLAHCQVCRREALAAGLDRGLLVRRPAARRVAERIGALLPLPGFLRLRLRGHGDGASARVIRSPLAAHLPAVSEQLSGPWSKGAAGLALLVAGLGTGVGVHQIERSSHPSLRPAAVQPAVSSSRAAHAAPSAVPVTTARPSSRSGGGAAKGAARSTSAQTQPAAGRATSGGGAAPAPTPATGAAGSGSTGTGRSAADAIKRTAADSNPLKPAGGATGTVPQAAGTVQGSVQQAAGAVQGTVQQAAGAVQGTVQQAAGAVQGATGVVQGTVQQATGTVNQAVQQATGPGPVSGAVQGATGAANQTVSGAKQTVDGAAGAVSGAVKQATGGLLGGH